MSVFLHLQECLFKLIISSAPVPDDHSSHECRTHWCAGIIILVTETNCVLFASPFIPMYVSLRNSCILPFDCMLNWTRSWRYYRGFHERVEYLEKNINALFEFSFRDNLWKYIIFRHPGVSCAVTSVSKLTLQHFRLLVPCDVCKNPCTLPWRVLNSSLAE